MDRVRGGCRIVCSKDWFSPVPLFGDRFSRISNSVAQQCQSFVLSVELKDSIVNINAPHDLIVEHDTEQKRTECSMILGRVKTTMDWNETTMRVSMKECEASIADEADLASLRRGHA